MSTQSAWNGWLLGSLAGAVATMLMACAPHEGGASTGSTPQAPAADQIKGPTPPPVRPGCPDGLFASVDDPGPLAPDPTILRRRAVRPDVARLAGDPARLVLNLFEDTCLVALRRTTAPGTNPPGVWTGTIEGIADSSVTLVVNGEVVAGSVVNPPASYQIHRQQGAVHLVRQIDTSKLPQEFPPTPPPLPPSQVPKKKSP